MRGLALLCVAGCVATWEVMAVVSGNALDGWQKPWAYCWWVHSTYAFAMPVWIACAAHSHAKAGSARPWGAALGMVAEAWSSLRRPTLILFALSFMCGYTWFWSLTSTNVPTNNTLYQTQCAFVFVLSVVFLGERVTRLKVGCVVLAFGGVACVCAVPTSSSSGDVKSNQAWGIALALLSTSMYACYEVFFDLYASKQLRKTPLFAAPDTAPLLPRPTGQQQQQQQQQNQQQEAAGATVCGLGDERDGLLILGFIGLLTFFLGWIPLPLLSVAGLETFVMPSASTAVKVMTVGLSDLVFNGFLLVGIRASTPLIITVGTMMVIPVGFVVDVLTKGYELHPLGVFGVVCTMLGVIRLNLAGGAGAHDGGKN